MWTWLQTFDGFFRRKVNIGTICNRYGKANREIQQQNVVITLKKTWPAFLLFALSILLMLTVALPPTAKAAPEPASLDVKVDHLVEIRDSGLLIINETVKLSTIGENAELLQNFVLGFPYTFQYNLDYAFAFETSNPNLMFELELNAGMGRIGFYGVNVIFPHEVNVSSDKPYEFTLVFVFSNRVAFQSYPVTQEILFNATFPAYPSLARNASEANLRMVFPTAFNYVGSSFENEGINFTRTSTGSKQYFSYLETDLREFSDQTGWFVVASPENATAPFEVNEVKREMELSSLDQIVVSDSYKVVNKAETLSQINIKLPDGAFEISAFDDSGSIPADSLKIERADAHTDVVISFPVTYVKDEEIRFSTRYKLPTENYIQIQGWSNFQVSLTLFENFDWSIRKLTTSVVLPEGAILLSSPLSTSLNSVQNGVFRSSLTFVFENATPFSNLSFEFQYGRLVFWESFRPTLWMGALVVVVGAIASAWRVYKPTTAPLPTAIATVRVEELRSFVDSYNKRRRYQRELESLEARARKGKIPRRRYKVRKVSIESRLASFSRDLSALREKIRVAGPRYANLMRQLEVAEAELEGVEADLSRTEVRYRRGEVSAAAYHKLLEDSYRRRDRAKTTIDGVLLRLREEIS